MADPAGGMVLGAVVLDQNPSSLHIENTMPEYAIFQPLDGNAKSIERFKRERITLEWEYIEGDRLEQVIGIIRAAEMIGSREYNKLWFSDEGLLWGSGWVRVIETEVTPLPGAGVVAFMGDGTLVLPDKASVRIVLQYTGDDPRFVV